MTPDSLQKHILATYVNLRVGMAVIGIVFPVLLYVGGRVFGLPLQDSISAYYHASADGKSMRDVFVGVLFALGVFLYLYKGYTVRENYALNLGGIFAIGVAMFPTEWDCGNACHDISIHGICAVSFFLAIAYVCIWRSGDTLALIKDVAVRQRYRRTYRTIGIAMATSPVIAMILTLFFQNLKSYVYFVELTGVWAFAAYWFLKSYELRDSSADRLAVGQSKDNSSLAKLLVPSDKQSSHS